MSFREQKHWLTKMSRDKKSVESSFDFNAWVGNNDLNEIKNILIKHGLNDRTNLSTQSAAFATFMSDPVLYKSYSHLISKTVKLIQQLSIYETAGKSIKSFVVISETEENILQSLQTNLVNLDKKEISIQHLYEEYKQSIEIMEARKNERIQTVKNEIKSYFEKAVNEIIVKQQQLLNEVNKFDNDNNIQIIDQPKGCQIISESETLIKKARNCFSQTLSECNDIIHSSINIDRDEGKRRL